MWQLQLTFRIKKLGICSKATFTPVETTAYPGILVAVAAQ
jgi:hypothetical protein